MSRADPDPASPTSAAHPGCISVTSRPRHLPACSAKLKGWLSGWHGSKAGSDEAELRDLIASFLAGDIPEQQIHDHASAGTDAGDLDDAGIFVEIKVSRFLAAVGLPVPSELPGA
jgi:hypothetical protein